MTLRLTKRYCARDVLLCSKGSVSRDAYAIPLVTNRRQVLEKRLAQDLVDAVFQRLHARGFNQGAALVVQLKLDIGMGQSVVGHLPADVLDFSGDRLHELLSRRNVVEELADLDQSSLRPGNFAARDEFPSFKRKLEARLGF